MLHVFYDNRLGSFCKPYISEKQSDTMQIPDEVRKCVAFIGYQKESNNFLETVLCGTAFFTVINEGGNYFPYLVTARHIIANLLQRSENIIIRMNNKNGTFEDIRCPIHLFKHHPNGKDISILPFSPGQNFDYQAIPYQMFLDQKIIREQNISLGDEVFMAGLFTSHYGSRKNIPLIRTGIIAAMPEEPIKTQFFGDSEGFLIEIRSLGGLSGSPVFVHLSTFRYIGNSISPSERKFYLLGLLHGHWNLEDALMDIVSEDYAQEARKGINTGIGIAVPSFQILEALNHSELTKYRQEHIKRIQRKRLPVED